MGLDMYLAKKTYVSDYDGTRAKLKITGVQGVTPKRVSYIVEDVGYWRKANAIHNWFVNNVQDGDDDCKPYFVSSEQLEELLGLVNEVLKASKLVKGKVQNGYSFKDGKETPIMEDGLYVEDPSVAEELLPTTSGFFYGSTNYDQYYIDDLKETKTILETALLEKDADFEYNSSW